MPLADREWMREGATEAEVARRRRSRRVSMWARTATVVAVALIAGAAAIIGASHVSTLRPYLHLGSRRRGDVVHVKVWVPAAKHGHVRVVRVRVRADR